MRSVLHFTNEFFDIVVKFLLNFTIVIDSSRLTMESVLDISAHKYGNYHKYYTFHPSSARSNFFASGNMFLRLWEAQDRPNDFRILDIGCNEGNLSIDILEQAKKELPSTVNCSLLGIDIDSSLIELANTKYVDSDGVNHRIQFSPVNFMDSEATCTFMDTFFAQKCRAEDTTDVVRGFNIVCLFSITMWIHLNHDDKGLIDCLQRATELLTPLGSLVVEPQPWKCYKSADKRCRKLGLTRPLHYSDLLIRDIEKDLVSIVMHEETTNNNTQACIAAEDISGADVESKNIPTTTGDCTATGENASHDASSSAEPTATISSTKQQKQKKPKQQLPEQNKPHLSLLSTLRGNAEISTMVDKELGMQSYWDLGKEGWGRSILIFHKSLVSGMEPRLLDINNNTESDIGTERRCMEGDSQDSKRTKL